MLGPRYLKSGILAYLERRGAIEKIHVVQTLTDEDKARRLQSLKATSRAVKLAVPDKVESWLWRPKTRGGEKNVVPDGVSAAP